MPYPKRPSIPLCPVDVATGGKPHKSYNPTKHTTACVFSMSGTRTVRGHSEPRGESRNGRLGVNHVCQHRWSTVSSVSADSGVVGLSDEREDEEEPRRTQRSAGAEVERVDSGIGSGLAPGWKRPMESFKTWEAQRPCPDCGHRDPTREEGMCERCLKLRTERKEAILEFLNTESSYGEDLRIIKEEFYFPMQSAGLLTAEQLTVVFSNVQELIDVNDRFTEHLQDNIDQALDQVWTQQIQFTTIFHVERLSATSLI